MSVASHCHAPLKMLSKVTVHYDKLLAQGMGFIIESDETLVALQEFHPRLIWGQDGARYRELEEILVEVYRTLTLDAGNERNQKFNKRVQSALRSRMGGRKVEKQVAIPTIVDSIGEVRIRREACTSTFNGRPLGWRSRLGVREVEAWLLRL